ncbi:hypothetical protein AB0F81_42565 [Actinoplanes sp. NPDC024001]|uniref:hypothetical protein n=1 Tax=Actinoplanes sp. NPDC024001 TaxID=3154598 RepID=UPI00340215FA
MTARLARRYRWLLRCYPPGPRRAEMLGTLLECAPPDRARPTWREAVNLVRFGLRARLGRPAGTAIVVLAALVSLASGLLGAAGAARLGWEFAPSLPVADELKATVFPGLHVWGGGDAEPFVPSADGETTEFGYADYWVDHTGATQDVRAYAEGARDRLAAAGWDIRGALTVEEDRSSEPVSAEAGFWATTDGLVLEFSAVHWEGRAWYDSDGAASFTLSRSAPGWLTVVAVAGGLIGALAGWLLTGWASRRSEGHEFRSAAAGAMAWMTVLLTLFAALLGGLWSWDPERPGDEVVWLGLRVLTGEAGVVIAGLALLALAAARLRAVIPAVVVLAGVVAATGWNSAAIASCTPVGPPADPPASSVEHSRVARVYVAQDATAEQRNLAEAAIGRVWGTRGWSFHYDPTDAEYRDAYCGGGRLTGDSGMRVPYFWEIEMSSPGVFPALDAEVAHLPGIVAVRHAAS